MCRWQSLSELADIADRATRNMLLHRLEVIVLLVRRIEEPVVIVFPRVDKDRIKDDEYAVACAYASSRGTSVDHMALIDWLRNPLAHHRSRPHSVSRGRTSSHESSRRRRRGKC